MPDAVNKAFGRGCHCRNCQFKENIHNGGFGGFRCKLRILNHNYIGPKSFCSAGQPMPQRHIPADELLHKDK